MAETGETFKPGQKVPNSGIYDVIHDRHRTSHQVTCVFDEPFPPCRKCGAGVRYRLAVKAIHVKHDEDFKS